MSIAEYLNANFKHIKAFNEVTDMKDEVLLKGVNEDIEKFKSKLKIKKIFIIKKKINDEHDKHIKIERR